jgi:hypothetical protein
MSTEPLDPERAYYFNTRTGEVEQGYASSWSDRMGPYATRAEAENALAIAAQRNKQWEQADRDWDDD